MGRDGREHCANHSECPSCSLTAATKSDTCGEALGFLFFLFFRGLTVVKSVNVEESSVVCMSVMDFLYPALFYFCRLALVFHWLAIQTTSRTPVHRIVNRRKSNIDELFASTLDS